MLPNVPNIQSITPSVVPTNANPSVGVSSIFKDALKKVDSDLRVSSELKERYELGDSDVSLSEVMIEGQKAKISVTALVEVRNKGLEAYRDLINMPV